MEISLGVPQGSVLGPLLFLTMINYLAYTLYITCKLFADDTTLGDVEKYLNVLIFRFIKELILDRCYLNKRDINWS